ncbi:MAG: hypothetical protein AAGA48_12620 [Myxococcota bacterium]
MTGHRNLGPDEQTHHYVQNACHRLLEPLVELGRLTGAGVHAYSALATGADTLFAHAALELEIPLVGIVPFADYADDFEGPERQTFDHLIERCIEVIRLPRKRRTNHAYLAAGTTLVQHVDLVVAVWNGLPAKGLGGTGDVVAYAERRECPVVRIDPSVAGSSPK